MCGVVAGAVGEDLGALAVDEPDFGVLVEGSDYLGQCVRRELVVVVELDQNLTSSLGTRIPLGRANPLQLTALHDPYTWVLARVPPPRLAIEDDDPFPICVGLGFQ